MNSKGFSLLEVIIATAILVASSMGLLQLLSVGQQHLVRAERHAEAHFICQTLVDECQAGSLAVERVDRERVSDAPGWTYSVDLQPTQIANLIKVRVRVWREDDSASQSNDQPVFELVRWVRNVTGGIR